MNAEADVEVKLDGAGRTIWSVRVAGDDGDGVHPAIPKPVHDKFSFLGPDGASVFTAVVMWEYGDYFAFKITRAGRNP